MNCSKTLCAASEFRPAGHVLLDRVLEVGLSRIIKFMDFGIEGVAELFYVCKGWAARAVEHVYTIEWVSAGDAITQRAREIRGLLRSLGFRPRTVSSKSGHVPALARQYEPLLNIGIAGCDVCQLQGSRGCLPLGSATRGLIGLLAAKTGLQTPERWAEMVRRHGSYELTHPGAFVEHGPLQNVNLLLDPPPGGGRLQIHLPVMNVIVTDGVRALRVEMSTLATVGHLMGDLRLGPQAQRLWFRETISKGLLCYSVQNGSMPSWEGLPLFMLKMPLFNLSATLNLQVYPGALDNNAPLASHFERAERRLMQAGQEEGGGGRRHLESVLASILGEFLNPATVAVHRDANYVGSRGAPDGVLLVDASCHLRFAHIDGKQAATTLYLPSAVVAHCSCPEQLGVRSQPDGFAPLRLPAETPVYTETLVKYGTTGQPLRCLVLVKPKAGSEQRQLAALLDLLHTTRDLADVDLVLVAGVCVFARLTGAPTFSIRIGSAEGLDMGKGLMVLLYAISQRLRGASDQELYKYIGVQ